MKRKFHALYGCEYVSRTHHMPDGDYRTPSSSEDSFGHQSGLSSLRSLSRVRSPVEPTTRSTLVEDGVRTTNTRRLGAIEDFRLEMLDYQLKAIQSSHAVETPLPITPKSLPPHPLLDVKHGSEFQICIARASSDRSDSRKSDQNNPLARLGNPVIQPVNQRSSILTESQRLDVLPQS